jgi:uncharacterized protein DUF5658
MKSLSRAAVASPSTTLSERSPARAPLDDPAEANRPILRPALLATTIGLFVFLLIQGILAAYNVHLVRDAIDRGLVNGYPSNYSSLPRRLLAALILGAVSYALLALVGVAIARRGHRLLFVLPAVCVVLVSVVGSSYGRQPQPIGTEWWIQCFYDACRKPWFGHPWLGPLVDLALVLVPGWVVAIRVRARRWPEVTDPPAVAAILATAALVATSAWTTAVIQASVDIRAVVAVGVFGIVVGAARPWWPWLHVLFATLVAGSLVSFVGSLLMPYPGFSLLEELRYEGKIAWPIVVIGLLASGWQPLAWALRRMQERPFRLVVAVNLLNVVDAMMTTLAVRSGGAVEANPLVRFGGLPAKIILVGVLTWLLYRRRPTSLVWPAAALLWVACYHVGGILVNGRWLS